MLPLAAQDHTCIADDDSIEVWHVDFTDARDYRCIRRRFRNAADKERYELLTSAANEMLSKDLAEANWLSTLAAGIPETVEGSFVNFEQAIYFFACGREEILAEARALIAAVDDLMGSLAIRQPPTDGVDDRWPASSPTLQ
jgi:hypothetical protein